MNVVSVSNLVKNFQGVNDVEGVSFNITKGEIFGLLGPNGAGKTTTIRMMLDIFKPDGGTVEILGGAMTPEKKDRIGYIPEERGLYLDLTLERCLNYLGSLKGISKKEVRTRTDKWLERLELAPHKRKKIKELSKGMQQKAQIIVSILHSPELIIVDEPFSGLDTINTQLVKEIILELRSQGVTIIMSTHQMHQVEELCDNIVLIDKGRVLLHDKLETIKRRFAANAVIVQPVGTLPAIPGIDAVTPLKKGVKLSLSNNTNPQDVLKFIVSQGISIEKFELAFPSLDEIYIRVVKEGVAA